MKPGKFWFSQIISICALLQLLIWMNHNVMLVLIEFGIVVNSIFFSMDAPPSRRERIIGVAVGFVLLVLSIPIFWGRTTAFVPFLALLSLIAILIVKLRRKPAVQTSHST